MKKSINLFSVFCLSIGASLGSGFFLLPGVMAEKVGADVWLFFILALLPMIPAGLSMIELSTAFPKSGGIYYILSRILGPLTGTVAGLGSWLLMIFKIAFILQGIGIYLAVLNDAINPTVVSLFFLTCLMLINMFGAKKTAVLQNVFVIISLGMLFVLFAVCLYHVDLNRQFPNISYNAQTGIEVTGILFMSYIGLTKVIGVSGEIENPERNITRGMLLSMVIAVSIYAAGSFLFSYSVPADIYNGSLVPMVTVAKYFFGIPGLWLLVAIATTAFLSAANASLMSASRYPMAMSTDKLLPPALSGLNKWQVPHISIWLTFGVIVFVIIVLDPILLAKSASAFQFLVFVLICFAVIIVRESGLDSYVPGFRTPFYPWLQIAGIVSGLYFVFNLGFWVLVFSVMTVTLAVLIYIYYGKQHTKVTAAIFHVFAKLANQRSDDLDIEFRNILKEKGLRSGDLYNRIICSAGFNDAEEDDTFNTIYVKASEYFSPIINVPTEAIYHQLLEGTKIGMTPVTKGAALPHLKAHNITEPKLYIVRSKNGIDPGIIEKDGKRMESIYAFFFLISPESDPGQHLRILAGLASKIDAFDMSTIWTKLDNKLKIYEFMMKKNSYITLKINGDSDVVKINTKVGEIKQTSGCEVVFIKRGERMLENPDDDITLFLGDLVTIIGHEDMIKKIAPSVDN